MAAGRPIITNVECAMAAVVQEEECGSLVPYGDVEALRRAIIELRDDRSLRERLGKNGLVAFEKKYNWELMEERLVKLYKKLLI